MRLGIRELVVVLLAMGVVRAGVGKEKKQFGGELFTGEIPVVAVEIPEEGMAVLREYQQVVRHKRPERIDVKATVRQGGKEYKNVAVHLKGSFSFQPVDARPGLTLNFDKFEEGQTFHGLTKIHLNNSVQDPTYLCEQFGREVFQEMGIVCARATPAKVTLNGRDLGMYVLVEGVNKRFLKRNFGSAEGNLYDAGAGADVTSSSLRYDSGANPEDRSDLEALVAAARERDTSKRLERLGEVLDVEQFITSVAIEAIMVHWDGYAMGCNNYRVFHDVATGKMVFIPHGLDQLFGVSRSTSFSVTPMFKGMVAKALLGVPEARQRYFKRIEELLNNELSVEKLHERVDRLTERLRPALTTAQRARVETYIAGLKNRIIAREESVLEQLANPMRPVEMKDGDEVPLKGWSFRSSSTGGQGSRTREPQREIIRVSGGGSVNSAGGTWRSSMLLDNGYYEFVAMARTQGVGKAKPPTGVMLRVSGEKSTKGAVVSEEWTEVRYGFDVSGIEFMEFVAEYRGPEESVGEFDMGTMRVVRKGPPRGVVQGEDEEAG